MPSAALRDYTIFMNGASNQLVLSSNDCAQKRIKNQNNRFLEMEVGFKVLHSII